MSRNVLVPIADGSEDIETVTIINVLRRAGATVTVASCQQDGALTIKAAQGCVITADTHISQCIQYLYHLVVIPGGLTGSENLSYSKPLIQILHNQQASQRWYAAICAAPAIVLARHDLLDNISATCYPAFFKKMEGANIMMNQSVVVDERHRVITGQGPGVAMGFTFKLIDALYGKETYRPIAKQMIAEWAL